MKLGSFSSGRSRAVQLLAAVIASACGDGDDFAGPAAWTWSDLGTPAAMVSEYVSNHEPLLVVDDDLLLGTADGVWRRPLAGTAAWQRAGLNGKTVHALALTADEKRIIAVGFDPADETAPTAWYSTDDGQSWVAATVWPRGEPGGPLADISFPFYSLEADPEDADVVYGGLDGDTLAVTVDGGATWIMTDGATSPTFGYACVPHRQAAALVLLQGCEIPLDVAWVGARDVVEDDRFQLPDFRFLYGYPDFEQLANRRINSIAAPPGRDDAVLVGVEGGLVELTSESGGWTDRDDITASWIFLAEDGDTDVPYVYIRAIAVLDEDGDRLLFGGTLNDYNEELSLFERNGNRLRRIGAPGELNDPRIEQAIVLGADDVLVTISESEAEPDEPLTERTLRVFRLQRR